MSDRTPVDAAAIRRAAINEVAEAFKNLPAVAVGIRALADHPPSPVDDGWRPIDTAPKDGTRFLFTNGKDVVGVGRFSHGSNFAADSWQGSKYTVPTHWRPLPVLPPSPETTDGE